MTTSLRLLCVAQLVLVTLLCGTSAMAAVAGAGAGVYGRIEASFELPQVQGNPFDFTQNDVKVTIAGPDGREVSLPAFFDGGQTWRVRHTPDAAGRYTVRAITLNGQDVAPQALTPRQFDVASPAKPGFVRIDPANGKRFTLGDGSVYYPIGYNLAWRHMGNPPMPALTESLSRMNKAGVNWTRIWMNHWDGKNLDWRQERSEQPELGQYSLQSIRLWDDIITSADQNAVYLQLVLQHHGQYSTRADANWQINPWNKANGGWLENAVQFFSDPKAIALTKSKYRYIIARWGYSPAIMAWELFNEVEYTDAFAKDLPAVAAWHKSMAEFIRQQDPYRHLITTSSRTTEASLWPAMDYYQSHVYPPDLLSAIATLEAQNLDRPYFYGEIGATAFGAQSNSGDTIHRVLWGSLMSSSSGAAQYWYWYVAEPENLLFHYTAAQQFIRQSGFLEQASLRPIDVAPETSIRGPLRFGPGTGWGASTTEFTVLSSGQVAGLGGMSAFLQGNSDNRAMFPSATLNVDYPAAGTFAVRIDEVTAEGGRLDLAVDGQRIATLDLGATPAAPQPQAPGAAAGQTAQVAPAAQPGQPAPAGQPAQQQRPRRNVRLNAALEVPVSVGRHAIRLENTGPDWVHIRDFTLTPYASQLAVLAKGNSSCVLAWVYRREPRDAQSISGTLSIPGIAEGAYKICWWDTYEAKVLREETINVTSSAPLVVTTPPIAQDVALWIRPAR